ncbi:MAG: ABC transporter permease [Balneola sp.]|nr:ABC transporter permease [Balneola sp.]MBO6650368.1 ABC transporter permease [Balneola sp.]MBO6710235.1 ABC transporter permease [Balneola sp.]MBO6798920.1 ABC transporter permease [Balneola sp.]MBO6870034.1 ABC transporter permease [Balneola sp.]
MRFLNSLLEGIKIAFLALSINKTRSFLTALCIIIGITMVTVVDAVTTGMDETFDNSMAMLGTNVVYIEKWPWDDDVEWWEIAGRKEMEVDYVDFLAERSRYATDISAAANLNVNIRYKENNAERVQMSGTTANHLEIQGLDISEGRMYTQEEVRTAVNVVVIGASLKEALFEEQDALGKQIRIGGQRFTVIGVLEKQGSFLGLGDADNVALIPIYAYNEIYGLRRGIQIGVKFANEATFEEGQYEIEGLMRQARQLDAAEENDFAINKPEAFKEILEGFKNGLYAVGFGLVALSLLIGGIGVMNIMFVSVRERTKEIGIRKAVGAKSWEILTQFLIEAIAICVTGGIFGVALAAIATFFIDQAFTATMNFGVIAIAFLICTMVGLLFGFIPAYRAAKSDPIESLRFE